MNYKKTIPAKFVNRINRFVAQVEINGMIETVHVKNTGRCKELLLPGAQVVLEDCMNPNRKTRYDLISVYKKNFGWINIDSQAPNKVAEEWLNTFDFDYIKSEYKYGDSRIDFYMEKAEKKYLMEVKGCTLEVDGIGYFPDAPTERGIKHIRELAKSIEFGYEPILAFVIQMEGIMEVRPNIATHPEFGVALEEAKESGVQVLFLPCKVREDSLEILSGSNQFTDWISKA